MKIYQCLYASPEANLDSLKDYAHYIRNTEEQAMQMFNKWKQHSTEEIHLILILEIEVDVGAGTTSSKIIAIHTNPKPKKVIYNKQAGVAQKKSPMKGSAQFIAAPNWDVNPLAQPAMPEAAVDWQAAHQFFQNAVNGQ